MEQYEIFPDEDLKAKSGDAEAAPTITAIAADETAMTEIASLRENGEAKTAEIEELRSDVEFVRNQVGTRDQLLRRDFEAVDEMLDVFQSALNKMAKSSDPEMRNFAKKFFDKMKPPQPATASPRR